MPKRRIIILTVLLVFLFSGLARAGEMLEEYKIKFGIEAISVKIKKMGENRWTARIDDRKYSLQGDGQGKYEFKWPDGKLDGKLASSKFKLKNGDEDFLEVKFSGDKIKIRLPDSQNDWSIKSKDGKLKVFEGEIEIGKVQYYPETGKLKAKDNAGIEVAEMKEAGWERAVLAPFLMGGAVPLEQRLFLVLLFFSQEK